MTALEEILAGDCELVIPHEGQPFIRKDWDGKTAMDAHRYLSHDEVTEIVRHECVVVAHRHPLMTCYRTRKTNEPKT